MATQYQRESGFANESQTVQYQTNGVFVNAPEPATISGTVALTTAAASLSATGSETYSGTVAVSTTAASFAATGSQEFSGTATFASTAASLAALGSEVFSGTISFTGAAASLDISGKLEYNGSVALETAAASISGTGSTGTSGITGVVAFTTAAASFRVKGRKRFNAGHDVIDLARYDRFVSQASQILEELGQTQPEPLPLVELAIEPIPPAQFPSFEFKPQVPDLPTLAPLAVPDIPAIKGKQWVRGVALTNSTPSAIEGQVTVTFTGRAVTWHPATTIAATGSVDNYYTIRQQDDKLVEEFILRHLLSAA